MKTSDFDFDFPQDLIAHCPAKKRDASRLMVLDMASGKTQHRKFSDIVNYLHKGDLLVLNDTRVISANLVGVKEGGTARIEVLLADRIGPQQWRCMVKPGKRLKVGGRVVFGGGKLIGTVMAKEESGEQIISFSCKGKIEKIIKKLGETPLPPYIKKLTPAPSLRKRGEQERARRYQTVYAKKEGASAAPTAGLHFTQGLLKKIKAKGVKIAYITLHTGLATFKPVYANDLRDHKMHEESYSIPLTTINAIKKARRVVAVGTTVVRALESVAATFRSPQKNGGLKASATDLKGKTNLFIYPGYKFKVVDAMITNFHFPRSTLVMMVSAFAGKDKIEKAYKEAFSKKYRLFSFGDAMFIK
ncbi:MAG: tRNA preQ1(34) S-adenosylmethionine ribosyltransferase-isomerase QueA [Candidatus Margulisbacteria bacterium]|nr:tRNA preQ1(34) S-adenosylmethionine ribosyltransferase-isomerase QueA [Candidatus Margulisiibacteriota bacterium]